MSLLKNLMSPTSEAICRTLLVIPVNEQIYFDEPHLRGYPQDVAGNLSEGNTRQQGQGRNRASRGSRHLEQLRGSSGAGWRIQIHFPLPIRIRTNLPDPDPTINFYGKFSCKKVKRMSLTLVHENLVFILKFVNVR